MSYDEQLPGHSCEEPRLDSDDEQDPDDMYGVKDAERQDSMDELQDSDEDRMESDEQQSTKSSIGQLDSDADIGDLDEARQDCDEPQGSSTERSQCDDVIQNSDEDSQDLQEEQNRDPDDDQARLSDKGLSDDEFEHGSIEVPSSVSSGDNRSNLLLLALKLKHRLSSAAIQDVSKLVNFTSGKTAVATSAYFFNKTFSTVVNDYEIHHICKHCECLLGVITNGQPVKCRNISCLQEKKNSLEQDSYFMYLPMGMQLRDLLENHNISHEIISMHSRRLNADHAVIQDVCDGAKYKNIMVHTEAFDCLSLTFNCDGVPIFK